MRPKKNMIIYQIALRTFTPDGTLNAAKDLLPHVASLGVDIVYVCPFFRADDDEDRITWSRRQKASNTDNPKNPYKIADYFTVDEEYGTNDDLKAFVDEAHRLGLLVMFDLVYLHCGRNAVFAKDHPEYLVQNEDGTLYLPDDWPFARINFKDTGLRKYLLSNMEYLVTSIGADGFRCDVGDAVPLDFWEESFNYLRTIKPSLITLNEGSKPELLDKAFDYCYGYIHNTAKNIFAYDASASELVKAYYAQAQKYGININRVLLYLSNHDIASDCGLDRNEIIMTSKGVEAALVLCNTLAGITFMWNGYEFCDNAENCMFSNRFYGKRSTLNWSRAFTPDGQRRMIFIREIHDIHHSNDAIINGKLEWIDNDSPDDVISFIRKSDNQTLIIVINAKNKPVNVKIDTNTDFSKALLQSGVSADTNSLKIVPYGYIIAEI